MASGKAGI